MSARKGPAGGQTVQIDVPARPRKQPRQERSVALVEALRDTCREILEQEGREALSVNRVAERAGVGVSSIYEYYPTLEALIAAVFDELRREARTALVKDIETLPPGTTLAEGINMMLRSGIATINRWAAIEPNFFTKFARYDELVRLDVVFAESALATAVSESLLARFADEITVHDLDKARFFLNQTLLSLLRAAALMRPGYMHDDNTPRLLGRMIHALLTD